MAIEVNKAASGSTLKDFKEKLNTEEFKAKVQAIRAKVEEFAVNFPMPGFDDY